MRHTKLGLSPAKEPLFCQTLSDGTITSDPRSIRAAIALMNQNTANKRLDFEIARLKNCGELMKAGIMFHKNSPYFAVCADVVLVNPPGTLPNHSHSITPNPLPTGNASDLKTISIGNN